MLTRYTAATIQWHKAENVRFEETFSLPFNDFKMIQIIMNAKAFSSPFYIYKVSNLQIGFVSFRCVQLFNNDGDLSLTMKWY